MNTAERQTSPLTYEEMLEQGSLSYEEICDHSRQYVEEIDHKRWIVGDDACAIDTKYGDHTMQDFARDVGLNKSTLAGWKRVSEFYPDSIRRKLLGELANLTYSHYKDALRLKDLDEAVKWLEKVNDLGWSPDQASYELTKELGHETQSSIPGMIENIYTRDGMCIIEVSIGLDDEEAIRKATSVVIKTKSL